MKKLTLSSQELIDAVQGWTKASPDLYVHATGIRIERRGPPDLPGWYLVSPFQGDAVQRYEPTTDGCDAAFVAFACRRSVAAFFSRVLRKPDRRAG